MRGKPVLDRAMENLPGFNTVLGNSGWLGESGKCCGSMQNAAKSGNSPKMPEPIVAAHR
jgi:hypothetical protein